MYRNYIVEIVQKALRKAYSMKAIPEVENPDVSVEIPKKKEYGDYCCNIALVIGGRAAMEPSFIAKKLVSFMDFPPSFFQNVSVSSKGFINFILSKDTLSKGLLTVVAEKEKFGRTCEGAAEKIHLESFDTTTPISLFSVDEGRRILIGDFLRSAMGYLGYAPVVDSLMRDCGDSLRLLGLSVEARYRELLGDDSPFPANGYRNKFVVELAREILSDDGAIYLQASKAERMKILREKAYMKLIEKKKKLLRNLGVECNSWVSSKQLLEKEGLWNHIEEELKSKELIYEKDGLLYMKTTACGDQKDRILMHEGHEPSDLFLVILSLVHNVKQGYMKNIFFKSHESSLDFSFMMSAVVKLLGFPDNCLEVVPIEKVRLIEKEEGEASEVQKGETTGFGEVLNLTNRNVMRFFFFLKSADTVLDFDVPLTRKESTVNPLYYVQFAFSRIKSLYKMAETKGLMPHKYAEINVRILDDKIDMDLVKKVIQFPSVLHESVQNRDPYALVYFTVLLVNDFHNYYASVNILGSDASLAKARVVLVEAVRIILTIIMDLLKIKLPEKA